MIRCQRIFLPAHPKDGKRVLVERLSPRGVNIVLVAIRKEGVSGYYHVSGDDVLTQLDTLGNMAERSGADVDRLVSAYLTVKDSLEPVPAEELSSRAREGLVTVRDVRPPEEYAAGHLPGAVNVPLSELEKHLKKLLMEQEIVAYCRGPCCVPAFEAVARLRARGMNAHRLQNGSPEWKQGELPVEQ